MGLFTKLFGKAEPMSEIPPVVDEGKDNKDLLWGRISQITSFVDSELRAELMRADEKKWIRATFSDFRNFHIKFRDFRVKLDKELSKLESVPLQSPMFQDYTRSMLGYLKALSTSLKNVEDQLYGEKNITEIARNIKTAINNLDDFKGYWNTVRKHFLE